MKKEKNKTKKTNPNVIEIDNCLVTECLPNAMFRVKLPNDVVILCTINGKMRIHNIRILPDDRVKVEMSPYDMSRGRISYRYK